MSGRFILTLYDGNDKKFHGYQQFLNQSRGMAQISSSLAAKFFGRLAVGYKAGLDLRSLIRRESTGGTPAFKSHLASIAEEIGDGNTLAAAMKNTDGFFNRLQCTIVDAGEKSGRLEEAFANLSDHHQRSVDFRRTFLVAIAWPVIELLLAILIVGLMILVMGWVASISNSKPIDWLGFGWSTTQYFAAYVALVMTALTTLVILIMGTFRGWFGLLPLKIGMKLPVIGGVIEKTALSRFAWVIQATYEAGIRVADAVKMALRATQNWYYTSLEPQVIASITEGTQLYETLKKTGVFNDEFLAILDNGELTGNLPESMGHISKQYQEQVLAALRVIAIFMFFLVFILVGAIIVLCIVIAFRRLMIDPLNRELESLGFIC